MRDLGWKGAERKAACVCGLRARSACRCTLRCGLPIPTPHRRLMKPACPAGRHSQVALHLLDAGADPNRLDFSGRNVLDLAVLHGSLEVVEELLNMGCWFTGGSGEQEGQRAVHLAENATR